jgi:predicted RNase H-like nuclease (RuvC/YqgF family)
LRSEIDNIRKENSSLLLKSSESGLMESYKSQIQDLQGRNLQLEGEISRLKSENYNLENEKSLMMQNISFRR